VYLVASGTQGFSLTDDHDCHVYLLDGGSEAALIDAGGGRDTGAILKNIEDDGVPLDRIRYLLLTHGHADHAAGAAQLREVLDLQVLASRDIADALRQGDEGGTGIALNMAKRAGLYPADFGFQACPVDVELEEGQRVAVGNCELLVMETPGHSAGHLSFLVEKDGAQLLFGGDAVFFGGRILLQNLPDCDLQAYLRTIERLNGLAVDAFLPGHLCLSVHDGQRHLNAAMEALSNLGVPAGLL
jgi:glyoxylase-like metal-dependent hydrolase (beta-lactamase superfamily II)